MAMSDSVKGEVVSVRIGGKDPYDLLPYESRPYPDTQPGQLSALAVLHGLEPAEVTRGRVLELGCASGGNIVTLAMRFPEASFVGIDLSARHVADGQACIRALGLTNVELRQDDLANCNIPAGAFDTIICHGVYSWVPRVVQEAILRIVATHLAPTGLAYVSYNTHPGWHLRQVVRDIF
jgi:SAM-dependent methyltransferase